LPTALVAALAMPIRELQDMVGPGWSSDPLADPAAVLDRVRDALTEVAAASQRSWLQTTWTGAGADSADGFIAATVAQIDRIAVRAGQLSTTASTASAAVARAHGRLETIIERFEARAAALEPHLDSPAAVEELLAQARGSLTEATAVVEELQAELDTHSAELTNPAPTSPMPNTPMPTAPAGLGSSGMPSMVSGFGGGPSMNPMSSGPSGSGLGDLVQSAMRDGATPEPEAAMFGDGVAVRLPDGSTATAPNAMAADAVRHALTQLGVPYDWGGTAPGVGLDCSGLTQWAYHEAGLNLPRLAQEQDVGASVAAGDLRPGDLAVWDGHVAMIVGNGTMIEAGDPVHLSPIRTTNAGQGFQGFWRPTA
jgi:cell wall-associated NlpC family hydrolase